MFTATVCRSMAKEMELALQEIAKKHGVTIRSAGGRFSPTNWTTKFEVSVIQNGEVITKERTELEKYGAGIGLKDAYGKTFESHSRTFKVVGLKLSAHKYPVVVEEVGTGKRYKFQIEAVTRHLK